MELKPSLEGDRRQLRGSLPHSVTAVGHAYALSLEVVEGDRPGYEQGPCCIAPAKASSSPVATEIACTGWRQNLQLWRLCDQMPQPAPRAVQVEDAQRKAADDRQRREKERCSCSALLQEHSKPCLPMWCQPHLLLPYRTSDHIEAVPPAPPNKHAAMVSTAGCQECHCAAAPVQMNALSALQGIRLVVD